MERTFQIKYCEIMIIDFDTLHWGLVHISYLWSKKFHAWILQHILKICVINCLLIILLTGETKNSPSSNTVLFTPDLKIVILFKNLNFRVTKNDCAYHCAYHCYTIDPKTDLIRHKLDLGQTGANISAKL